MSRLLRLALALLTVGLWASLLPQVTYSSASAGELSNNALIAWPGWGVQQDLGPLRGSVGRFEIWASAQPGGPEVKVHATLIDESTREVLRDKWLVVSPAYIPVSRTVTFPIYVIPEGQRLILQLQVPDFESHYVVYRLAVPQAELSRIALNGLPDAGSGPLAFAHVETGSGLRAAHMGHQPARIRLLVAGALSVLAITMHPRVSAGLRRLNESAQRPARRPTALARRLYESGTRRDADQSTSAMDRALNVPWYPWLAATIPILYFLANNNIHFSLSETIVPIVASLLVITGSVVVLRLVFNEWNRPAAAITSVTIVFFAYGHVEHALDGRVNKVVFFAGAVVLAVASIAAVLRVGRAVARGTQFLNIVAAALFVFQAGTLAVGGVSSLGSPLNRVAVADSTSHLFPAGLPSLAKSDLPDIYYIVLDAYGRNDALVDFDNSEFLRNLESRGFYVASEASSNYIATVQSLASSLNMSYLDALGDRTPATYDDIESLVHYNALSVILKELGYSYVHLESGYEISSSAPLADILVNFGPAGLRVVTNESELAPSINPLVSRVFLKELIRTTALHPVAEGLFQATDDARYSWWSPHRTLAMFDFLSRPIELHGPKFVFAHILKPANPATFDRYGNYVLGTQREHQFRDDHDPSVPNAYTGQLIYINTLLLDLIDDILREADRDPIIVIAGDHNLRKEGQPWHSILAAFFLPGRGAEDLYSSISSVNHFRHILKVYFGYDLDRLEDRTVDHGVTDWDFRPSSTTGSN